MSDKKPSNARCKHRKAVSKKTVKGAMKNKGDMIRKFKTPIGPVRVIIPTTRTTTKLTTISSTINKYSIEG